MIIPNEDIFPYYFYFMQERMNIFWNKYDQIQPLTNDMILEINKFSFDASNICVYDLSYTEL